MRGATNISLDAKGRFAVPGKYRDELLAESAGNMMIAPHPHGCLVLYTKTVWQPIEDKIKSLPSFNSPIAGMQRLMVGSSEELVMDGAGRLLLSATLRKLSKLENESELVIAGMGDHFELWNVAGWDAQIAKSLAMMNDANFELPAELNGFSL